MRMTNIYCVLFTVAVAASVAHGQNSATPPDVPVTFDAAAADVRAELKRSLADLNVLRERMAEELIPLNRDLENLEQTLTQVREEYQKATRLLNSSALELSNLTNEIKSRHAESTYLSNLFSEYIRNFESRLHIAELQRYRVVLEDARLAAQNSGLSQEQLYGTQTGVISTSLDRLEEALNGARFTGSAVDSTGRVLPGTFVVLGPAAVFRSQDGRVVGAVEQRLGSLEPAVIPYGNPIDTDAASSLVGDSKGWIPLDPTLGNAHKVEATEETWLEHVKKGGPVMIPIFTLAGAALLVALYKWLTLVQVRQPSRRQIATFLGAVAQRDQPAALRHAQTIPGPIGHMLTVGVEHLREPRELIEEVMYEAVLAARLRLQRLLPFIAICAAAAPLLGLLGTVTGIMNTFKLITVFGTGDVKTLSGGISEALITTKYGLIVAIPSLLMHAFLSRKARGVVDQMEKAAVAFINQVSKAPLCGGATEAPPPNVTQPKPPALKEATEPAHEHRAPGKATEVESPVGSA